MGKNLFLIFLLLSILAFYSCAEEDDFSSDSELMLSFSSEKISFDTLFSSVGSATRKFKIYNRNSKSLLIERIELMNSEKSGFRMNIDGEKGTKLANLEVLKKDSLFGFVEVTIDPHDSKNPIVVRDSIRFVTNGNVQYLYLEAIGKDVFIWKKKTISKDTVVTALKPILVYDTLTIEKGINLSIEKGSVFYMNKDAPISVYGTLIAKGSVEEPIVFRGDRFDNIEGNIPYDNVPGQWGGVYFHTDSYGNQIENLHIRNAVRGMTFYRSNPQKIKAELRNTIVQNTSHYGVLATNSNIVAENCLFTNSKTATLMLEGGKYSFVHCTIANYYGWGRRQSEALIIKDFSDSKDKTPLLQCDFANSIIYGTLSDELLLDSQTVDNFNYKFNNCIIKVEPIDNERINNVVWRQDPLFKDLNSSRIYEYDFDLKENSPAIDKANKSFSTSVPFDIKGRPRLLDSNPDIGCYEWSK